MLHSLAAWLQTMDPSLSFLRVFQYQTFRAVMAAMTALLIGVVLGPRVIRRLLSLKIGQPVRTYAMETHLQKHGTPTMGGVLILLAIGVATFLWCDLSNRFVWLTVFVTFSYGAVGLADDWKKVVNKDPEGMRSREKFIWQCLIGLVASFMLLFALVGKDTSEAWSLFMGWINAGFEMEMPKLTHLSIPFFKSLAIPMGMLGFVVLSFLVIVGASNAVNFTDGLDGLASMPVVLVGSTLGLFAYLSGHAVFANYLFLPHIPGTGELLVFCCAMSGACLAFLWFNAHPAQIFMGDVGALSLGAALGVVAVAVRQELVLAIMGGVFVAEALSVILQVSWFKFTKKRFGEGRRIFKMAPLHHHFEKSGWAESQVVVRFWIVTMLLCLLGLATLKLR